MTTNQVETIRRLNDAFRITFRNGQVVMTRGVQALGPANLNAIIAKVHAFNTFTSGNDPEGEHDFGAFEHGVRGSFGKSTTTPSIWSTAAKTPPILPRPCGFSPLCWRRNTDRRSRATPRRKAGFCTLGRGDQEFLPGAARGLQRRQPGWRAAPSGPFLAVRALIFP